MVAGAAVAAGCVLRWSAVSGRALQGLAGLGLLAFGCWLAYPPAGWIVGGLGLLLDRLDDQRDRKRGAG